MLHAALCCNAAPMLHQVPQSPPATLPAAVPAGEPAPPARPPDRLTMVPARRCSGFSASSPWLISQVSFSSVTTISPSDASRDVLPDSRTDTLRRGHG
jgi:hypothetical protein